MANRTKLTPEKEEIILSAIREGHTVTAAARSVGIRRQTVYDHKDNNPAFALLLEEAANEGGEVLEGEARRRAFEGVEKPVFYQGAECGTVREYSDTLLIFLLKGKFPERYRDNSTVQHTGKVSLEYVNTWRNQPD